MERESFVSDRSLFGSELYIKDVLCEYGYPRSFICETGSGDTYYLFYEIEASNESTVWVVTRILESIAFDLSERNKSINSVYLDADGGDVFIIRADYFSNSSIWSRSENNTFDPTSWFMNTKEIYADEREERS